MVAAHAADMAPACASSSDEAALCGFQRPEDLESLDGGKRLLVSEYGGLTGETPGRLIMFDPATGARHTLYPNSLRPGDDGAPWGDPGCPGPPGIQFAPHGIHFSEIGGASRVLAVNHAGREAVEIFELNHVEDPKRTRLVWRGCVIAPGGLWLNDVVGLPHGGMAVSHMVVRGLAEDALFAAEVKQANTGWVVTWLPERGWQRLPGSEGSLPNGLEISDDGAVLYINEYFGDHVSALELASGQRLWRSPVAAPDNSSWTAEGNLLIASHSGSLADVFACNQHPDKPCAMPYELVVMRPRDGASEVVFRSGGDLMGAATVALESGFYWYLGSFVGDRLVRIKRPPSPQFPPFEDSGQQ